MTPRTQIDENAGEYQQTALWLMDQAEWEFRQGDFMQASEKAWGAVAQFLKALATERGWDHHSHYQMGQISDNLAAETGNAEIRDMFSTAEGLHANFYEAYKPEDEVRSGIDEMQRFLSILEAIPPPETPARRGYTKKRTFYRTRANQPLSNRRTR